MPLSASASTIGLRRVVEREGRGARDRARHIGDAIVDHAVHHISRLRMAGRPRGLRDAALIDRDVDDHRAGLHRLHRRLGDELRRRGRRATWPVPMTRSARRHSASIVSVVGERGAHAGAELRRRNGAATPRCGRRPSRPRRGPPRSPPRWCHHAAAQDPAPRRAGRPARRPSSTPRPPLVFSSNRAPICGAMRPATSDIGVNSGSVPAASVTVS